eukprot:Gb_34104 [translate_table: standard]
MFTLLSSSAASPSGSALLNSQINSFNGSVIPFSLRWAGCLSPTNSEKLRWAIPKGKINRFGAQFNSKAGKLVAVSGTQRSSGIFCLQKPGSKESMVEQNQNMASINFNSTHDGHTEASPGSVSVGQPSIPPFLRIPSLPAADQAFFLLSFIACMSIYGFKLCTLLGPPEDLANWPSLIVLVNLQLYVPELELFHCYPNMKGVPQYPEKFLQEGMLEFGTRIANFKVADAEHYPCGI